MGNCGCIESDIKDGDKMTSTVPVKLIALDEEEP